MVALDDTTIRAGPRVASSIRNIPQGDAQSVGPKRETAQDFRRRAKLSLLQSVGLKSRANRAGKAACGFHGARFVRASQRVQVAPETFRQSKFPELSLYLSRDFSFPPRAPRIGAKTLARDCPTRRRLRKEGLGSGSRASWCGRWQCNSGATANNDASA